MKAPRFHLPDPPRRPGDTKIIDKATHLQLDAYRDMDGDCHFQFQIDGTFGLSIDGQSPEDFEREQREGLALLRELLNAFERKRKDGDRC